MSYNKSLKDLLKEKNMDLFNRLPEIEREAKNILQYSQAKFPYYTPHGFQHSENVLENLNWLLPEDVKSELNCYELFFLIVSAWLHDWGLIGTPMENPETIRETHHARTEKKFQDHFGLVRVSMNEARIIGRICKGHRKEDLFREDFKDTPFEKGFIIHRQFLAAALRLADEIDVSASRVPEIIYFELNPTEKAQEEFEKQMSILGVAYPSEKEKFKLVLSAVARDPLGVVTATKLRDKIQEELNSVKTILATGINRVGMQLDYVELSLDTIDFEKDKIEFQIDRKQVLDLLIGRSLYPRKDVAIRELLQNAIDACKQRKSLDGHYEPEIIIAKVGDTLFVEDNGVGMDFTTAQKYLSLVGSSYYSSEEFTNLSSDKNFDPISRWGLGFLSCFLIAREVTIETKKNDCPACRFVISSIDRVWRYELGTKKTSGTTISLHLTEENEAMDLQKVIQYYIKRSEVPIYLCIGNKKELIADWNIETELENQSKTENSISEVDPFEPRPTLLKTFTWSSEDFDTSFFVFNKRSHQLFDKGIVCCLHGIKIKLPASIDLSLSNIVIFLNIKRRIVDFDIAREFLLDNEKLRVLLRKVALAYIQMVNNEFNADVQGYTLFNKEINRYQFLSTSIGWSSLIRLLTFDDRVEFLGNSVNPIITRKKITYERLTDLFDKDPFRVIIFDCTESTGNGAHNEQVSKMLTLIQQSLGARDTVLLFFGPFFYKWEQTLSAIFEDYEIQFKWGDLEKYAARLCKAVRTPIDTLLPDGCHLAVIPKEFGDDTIRRKWFISTCAKYNLVDDSFGWTTISRYGPILFFDDFPDIYRELVRQGIEEAFAEDEIPESFFNNLKNQTKRAEYFLNVDNKTVRMLIKNSEKIKNDSMAVDLAKIIIRSLLVLSREESTHLLIFSKGLLTESLLLLKGRLKSAE